MILYSQLPSNHNVRLRQARARAQWELGDASWADILLKAYWDNEEDKENLDMETDDG